MSVRQLIIKRKIEIYNKKIQTLRLMKNAIFFAGDDVDEYITIKFRDEEVTIHTDYYIDVLQPVINLYQELINDLEEELEFYV